MTRPSRDFPDDEYLAVALDWQLCVVDNHLVATRVVEFDGDRNVDVKLTLPPMSGGEIEDLLGRIDRALAPLENQTEITVTIPASPGYYALERYDREGVFDVDKHAVIAWRITSDAARPVTIGPSFDPVAVLMPDRRVEDFLGIRHASLAEYLDWERTPINWDEVVLPDLPQQPK